MQLKEKAALFDARDPRLRDDPYPLYKRLRDAEPVHRTPYGHWVISGYSEVASLIRKPQLSSEYPQDPRWAEQRGGWDSPIVESTRRWMLMRDGGGHRRLRGLANPLFTARAIHELAPRIAGIVHQIMDEMGSGRDVDLIGSLAARVPVTVFCGLGGLPVEDADLCRKWTDALGHVIDPAPDDATRRSMNDAAQEFGAYVAEHLALRRAAPRDDLLSRLLLAEFDGEKLTDDEIIANVLMFFMGGHETTVNLIGNGMLGLLRHPEQLRALREDPGLIQNGIDELVRYDAPIQLVARITTRDVEVGDTTIPAGSKVMILLGAANRDPRRYSDPDRLDLSRRDVHPMSFGGGPHYCIGAMLAKAEACLVFTELVGRYRDITLAREDVVWRPQVNIRGLGELRVDLVS
ncbi:MULTISPECIES: cytochrome P450 [unclassified Streptomyces]|uniref:cytochrome P450 n=1 Tax=unclassified Streptomyces TaxID=2593676 RepID=UPI001BE8AC60|nr:MULTISPECIES: cytochrome P450 [unclassified Streptomyces]MBT2408752.1 cytochrome P450 [Streptomyces sp. ISL-21]MBT2613836.1 cytochrome P450 [Streptomyces sp. ISL-87]